MKRSLKSTLPPLSRVSAMLIRSGGSPAAAAWQDDDDDDFDAEERAAKKLKKGTLSQEAFDHAFFDSL